MNPGKIVLGGLHAIASIQDKEQRESYFDAIQEELNRIRGLASTCKICGGLNSLSKRYNKSWIRLQAYNEEDKQNQFQAIFSNDKFGTVSGVGDNPQSAITDLWANLSELEHRL